jgi:hypothetical protein
VVVTALIRKSANLAYTGIHTPFVMLENRLPEGSRVRAGLHAALQVVDSSVEQVLHRLDGQSAARSTPSAAGAAEAPPSQDREAEREAIEEAVRERQPNVGELADRDLDVAEVQAHLQAKHAIETREEVEQSPDDAAHRPTGQ